MGLLDDISEALTGSTSKRRASGDTSGKGGRARGRTVDSIVDAAAGTPAPPADKDRTSNAGRQAQSTDAYNGY